MFEKDMMFPALLDIYGSLLTERKREVLDYYYNEDYSLAEISELTGISRQGVRDSIKKSEEEIYFYESKLNIAKRNAAVSATIDQAISLLSNAYLKSPDDIRIDISKVESMLNTLRTADKTDGDVQE